jgi:hypothetical protein
MKRCKNCGSSSDAYECMTVDPVKGLVFGKHKWQTINESVGGAPGPEYWANYDSSTPKQVPRGLNETVPADNYLTEIQPPSYPTAKVSNFGQAITSQQLLAQVQVPTGNPLNAQAPGYSGKPLNSQPTAKPFMSWHAKIIAECAPICRKLRAGEPSKPKMLPSDVRSRGPVV